jgi:hypothetical protein
MRVRGLRYAALAIVLVAATAGTALAQTSNDKVEAAISVIKILDRPGRDNLANVWMATNMFSVGAWATALFAARGPAP